MILASWYFHHWEIPCPGVWAEPRGLLLMNRNMAKVMGCHSCQWLTRDRDCHFSGALFAAFLACTPGGGKLRYGRDPHGHNQRVNLQPSTSKELRASVWKSTGNQIPPTITWAWAWGLLQLGLEETGALAGTWMVACQRLWSRDESHPDSWPKEAVN